MTRVDELLADLRSEHQAFHRALEAVDVELVIAPGVVDDWSVRDLVVHVAFWAEHAVEALHLAADGRGAEFAYDSSETDAMNARLLAESRTITPNAALEREERAFEALAAAVAGLEASTLDVRLGNGDTVAEVIRYDGPDHYREHTEHLRAWFADEDDADEDDAVDVDDEDRR
jgi:hypothetical protein